MTEHRSRESLNYFLDEKLEDLEALIADLREEGEIHRMERKHVNSLYKACMNFEQRLDKRR